MTDGETSKEGLLDEQDILARLTASVTDGIRALQALGEVIQDENLHDRLSGLVIQSQNTLEWAVNRFGEVQARLREEDAAATD